jgi:hypothetical protein
VTIQSSGKTRTGRPFSTAAWTACSRLQSTAVNPYVGQYQLSIFYKYMTAIPPFCHSIIPLSRSAVWSPEVVVKGYEHTMTTTPNLSLCLLKTFQGTDLRRWCGQILAGGELNYANGRPDPNQTAEALNELCSLKTSKAMR